MRSLKSRGGVPIWTVAMYPTSLALVHILVVTSDNGWRNSLDIQTKRVVGGWCVSRGKTAIERSGQSNFGKAWTSIGGAVSGRPNVSSVTISITTFGIS